MSTFCNCKWVIRVMQKACDYYVAGSDFFHRKCSSKNFHLGKAFGVLAFKSIAYSFKPHNVLRYTLWNQIPPKLLYAMNGIAEGIYSMANCSCNQNQFQNHVNRCWMQIHTFIVRCENLARRHSCRRVVFVSVTSLIIYLSILL